MRVCQFRHFGLKLLDGGDLIAVRKRKETKDLFLQSWGSLSNVVFYIRYAAKVELCHKESSRAAIGDAASCVSTKDSSGPDVNAR